MAKAEESPKKKKGLWRWLVFAGLGVVVLVAVMALFNICPPVVYGLYRPGVLREAANMAVFSLLC